MKPSELNILIAVATSYLFENISRREFFNLAVFLSLLSKEMLAMEAICDMLKIEKLEDQAEEAAEAANTPEEAEEVEELEEEIDLLEDQTLFGLEFI